MTQHPENDREVVALLILVAAALALGRVATAERVNEPSVHKVPNPRNVEEATVPRPAWPKTRPEPFPTYGSNDRVRWAAAKMLAEKGTFVVGQRSMKVTQASIGALFAARDPIGLAFLAEAGYRQRIASDTGLIFQDGWGSVDKVMRPDTLEFYSTKPPLLTLLTAGTYGVMRTVFGLDMDRDRWVVMRTILVLFNVLPFALYLWLLADLAGTYATTAFTKYFVVVAGAFAGMTWPFLVSLNNHTPAVTTATLALWATMRIVLLGPRPWLFAVGGLAAGLTFTFELPALSLAAGLFVYLAWKHPREAFTYFLPLAVLPIAVQVAGDYIQAGRLSPVYSEFTGPWYRYEGSHWRVPEGLPPKRGIDFAAEPKEVYAFHLLLGHHGWFSLMPVFFLALPGMALLTGRAGGVSPRSDAPLAESFTPGADAPGSPRKEAAVWSLAALLTLAVSVVVIGFYIWRTNNYGGWTNGPRWLMWLTPLWLVCMFPTLDRLSRSKWGRALAYALLVLSIVSMMHQHWSPWRHPWIYNWLESLGHIRY